MKILLSFFLLAAAACAQSTTQIVDTIRYGPLGTLGECTFTFVGPNVPATAPDGSAVTPSSYQYRVVAGVLDVALIPNDTLTPTGTSYRVTRACSPPGPAYGVETWNVTTSGTPLKIADVLQPVPPPSVSWLIQWRLYVGNWLIGSTYGVGNVVSYGGSSYVSLRSPNTGHTPTDAAWWAIIAAKGDTGSTGSTGGVGPAGPTGQGFQWRGAWSSVTVYTAYDLVSYAGSSYIAVAGSTNITPGTDGSKWQLEAQKGDVGPQGAAGSGSGDMLISTYDPAHLGSQMEVTAHKGAASGYPSLDSSVKIPIAQLPTGATGSTVALGNDSRLSDARTPTVHAASHKNGGGDEVATATPTANAIPKALGSGLLDPNWIPLLAYQTLISGAPSTWPTTFPPPGPGASDLGGVLTTKCAAGYHNDGYNSDGTPHCLPFSGGVTWNSSTVSWP